jgi:hypothetical protein
MPKLEGLGGERGDGRGGDGIGQWTLRYAELCSFENDLTSFDQYLTFINTAAGAQVSGLDAGFRFTRDGGATFPFRGAGVGVPTFTQASCRSTRICVRARERESVHAESLPTTATVSFLGAGISMPTFKFAKVR